MTEALRIGIRIRIYANRWFAKFAAKEKISDAALADAVHRAGSMPISVAASSSSASRARVEASRAAIARS